MRDICAYPRSGKSCGGLEAKRIVRLPWPVSNEPADQPKDSIPLLCGRNGGGGGGEGSCPVEDRAFVVLHEYSNTGHGEAGLGTIGGDGVAADKRTAGWLARRTLARTACLSAEPGWAHSLSKYSVGQHGTPPTSACRRRSQQKRVRGRSGTWRWGTATWWALESIRGAPRE